MRLLIQRLAHELTLRRIGRVLRENQVYVAGVEPVELAETVERLYVYFYDESYYEAVVRLCGGVRVEITNVVVNIY